MLSMRVTHSENKCFYGLLSEKSSVIISWKYRCAFPYRPRSAQVHHCPSSKVKAMLIYVRLRFMAICFLYFHYTTANRLF